MNKRIILALFSALFSISIFAQNTVTGYVYIDVNQNGKKDRKEKGVEGVAVSNNAEVVKTDKNGKYRLDLTGDNQIFVIKPSGYQLALDDYNLPKAYYTFKPDGSPSNTQYEGVKPTGKLPGSVDFGLIPQKEIPDFTAFIFGDPQPYDLEQLGYFRKVYVPEAKLFPDVSFGISLGDLVGDDLSLQPHYKEAIKEIGLPWYNVIGNHDMNYEATDDLYSDETFERNFGPANYAFNYGNAHFIVLDNILYPDPRDQKGYWGGFREDQLQFLENDLKFAGKDQLIIISFHIPLFVGDEEHFDPVSRQKFLDLLKDFPNVLLLSAHMHKQSHQFYTEKHGWKGKKPLHEYNVGTTSGDWYSGELDENGIPHSTMRDGTPKGIALLNIKGNQYTLDYKAAGKSSAYKLQIYAPKVIADKGWNTANFYVNIFMGSEKDSLQYRIDGGEWKEMKKAETEDPLFYSQVQKWDLSNELLTGRRPSNPEESTHLWVGRTDNKLGVGTHTIEVKGTDMFGRTYSESINYRIEEKK